MELFLVIISILAISGVAHLTNRVLPFKLCPVCAGIAGTWVLMLALRLADYPVSSTLLALLIGGSVVGFALLLEKRLSGRPGPWFKFFFIPVGFVAGYAIVAEQWGMAAASIITLSVGSLVFRTLASPPTGGGPGELEKKLEDCCE